MCQCGHCGKKKWSNRRKKTNKVLSLIAINVCIWFVNVDAMTQKKTLVFENPKITAVEAIRSMSESGNTSSPATETKEDPSMVKAPKASESSMSTTSPVIRASDAEAIKQVAEKYGLDWKILMGICIKESNCNPDRVGDGGKSYGAFQIHQKYHPGTIDCAKDLKCSAEWTAKRLKRHAHLGESEMVRSHNGLVANNANAYYVSDIYKIIESL